MRVDRDLHEIRTGWQGESQTSLAHINWDFYANPRHAEDEALLDVHVRMRRWLDRVLRRHAGEEVVGVSHGDPILILVGDLRGLPLEPREIFPRPYIATASLFRAQFNRDGRALEVDLFVPHAEVAA